MIDSPSEQRAVENLTEVFSSKAGDYARSRPAYPERVVSLLIRECWLTQISVIADIGSGTGLLTELFLKNGNRVYGVEPNREMREAGERHLRQYSRFKSIAARAESTTLEDQSIDFVTAGQAFHWFDPQMARIEFTRILKPQGWVVLVWNRRRAASTPFHAAYEKLLMTFGTDVKKIRPDHSQTLKFFGGNVCHATFENRQLFDFEGLKGRLLSSSKSPAPGSDCFDLMLEELQSIFDDYQEQGRVCLDYDTTTYYGRLV
ncbi:MAG: class I SAM-dependent methyltransferase [Acidobacteria bacterium]|nr:class I SAM-dependent methyltransferase [Acidobacteriota bacterium]MCI0623806.1 class I SAM-dependent methyltransferase [Acidobacteriota bacterium]MCI0717373.1 class I SAM-dependent methyltransferase [Acidobacteriota bacterium]